MSNAIADSFTQDRRRGDRLLAQTERRLAAGDWPGAAESPAALPVRARRSPPDWPLTEGSPCSK